MEENASNPVVEASGEGKGESIEGKDGPPVDDCCPICFGDFAIPCKANCGHWYCGQFFFFLLIFNNQKIYMNLITAIFACILLLFGQQRTFTFGLR